MTAQLSQKLLKPTVAAVNGRFQHNVSTHRNPGQRRARGARLPPPPVQFLLNTLGSSDCCCCSWKNRVQLFPFPPGAGRSQQTQVSSVSHQHPKPEIAFSKQISIIPLCRGGRVIIRIIKCNLPGAGPITPTASEVRIH